MRFELRNVTIQTYLTAICRNQVLIRLKKKRKVIVQIIVEELQKMKQHEEEMIKNNKNVSECYKMLRYVYFERKSMSEIAKLFNYNNADN